MVPLQSSNGNCLFHALAIDEVGSGEALRQEVANFVDACAACRPGTVAAQAWLVEASRLRGPLGKYSGGPVALIGYSAMRGCKVFVHTRQVNGTCSIQDATHGSVSRNAPIRHILYDGVAHYDALVDVIVAGDLSQLQPAWAQPHLRIQAAAPGETRAEPSQQASTGSNRPSGQLQLWAAFCTWASSAPQRQGNIPGYVLRLLGIYVWLHLLQQCPEHFLAELQTILRRALPEQLTLPDWVWDLIQSTRFTYRI